MNKVFHARIPLAQYLFLLLSGGMVLFLLWMKYALPAAFFVLWLIVIIEKLIHTTYTVTTDDMLVLYFGRFTRRKVIALKDITYVERAFSARIGGKSLMHYVLVRYGERDKCVVLLPVKEEEFLRLLKERTGLE